MAKDRIGLHKLKGGVQLHCASTLFCIEIAPLPVEVSSSIVTALRSPTFSGLVLNVGVASGEFRTQI
jgi:hypothetical protein